MQSTASQLNDLVHLLGYAAGLVGSASLLVVLFPGRRLLWHSRCLLRCALCHLLPARLQLLRGRAKVLLHACRQRTTGFSDLEGPLHVPPELPHRTADSLQHSCLPSRTCVCISVLSRVRRRVSSASQSPHCHLQEGREGLRSMSSSASSLEISMPTTGSPAACADITTPYFQDHQAPQTHLKPSQRCLEHVCFVLREATMATMHKITFAWGNHAMFCKTDSLAGCTVHSRVGALGSTTGLHRVPPRLGAHELQACLPVRNRGRIPGLHWGRTGAGKGRAHDAQLVAAAALLPGLAGPPQRREKELPQRQHRA